MSYIYLYAASAGLINSHQNYQFTGRRRRRANPPNDDEHVADNFEQIFALAPYHNESDPEI